MTSPLVSVVVPTLGGPRLDECRASIEAQTLSSVEMIVAAGDAGFAAAVNAGAAASRGRYLAIVNDDVVLARDWLAEAVACLERHPHAASVATKIFRYEDETVLDGAGDAMTRSLKAYRRGQGTRDDGRFDSEEQVFASSGTACVWRLSVFRMLGGFDEAFFAYYEDVDLGFRARLAGWECWYAPAAVASHVGSATARERLRDFESHYAVRNRWLMILKNAPSSWLVRSAPTIAIGELASVLRAAVRGDLALVFRAYRDVARCLPSVLSERRRHPERRGVTPRAFATESFPPLRISVWRLRQSKRLARTL